MVRERLHNGSPGLVLLPLLVLALGIPLRVFMTGVRAAQLREDTAAFYIIGAGLIVLAVLLAVATARGDVAESEEGEDVDLTKGSDWVTVGKLVVVFALNFALISWLGWAITGALLFAGTAHVLGARSIVRSLAIGVVLAVLSWYGFYSGLGLAIPAGVLDGVL